MGVALFKERIINIMAPLMLAVIIYFYLFHREAVASIAMPALKSHKIALILCLSLFITKCFVKFIPIGLIYFCCAYVLCPMHALLLCILGNVICFCYTYYEGKRNSIKKPRVIATSTKGTSYGFISALFIHCIRFFPSHTAVTYMGAAELPFWGCLIGSIIGALPSILLSLTVARR